MIRAVRSVIVLASLVAMAVGSGRAHSADAPIGRFPLQTRGIWTQFENPSSGAGWFSGEMIQQLGDPYVRRGVELQLDRMRAMGVNEIIYELRSADPVWIPGERRPPECNVPPVLGVSWPQPTQIELANLGLFFDLLQSKGVRVALMLNNTHMEEQPPVNSERWLGSILRVVRTSRRLTT